MKIVFTFLCIAFCSGLLAQDIPLSEHPRPDFEREQWENLNGKWNFAFDSTDTGIRDKWYQQGTFPLKIQVPFPWGSALSGVSDLADIAWYQRSIQVNPSWKNKRIFLNIGASDWDTQVWIDGQFAGSHQGGYTPFALELTTFITPGKAQQITIRVDDKRRMFTLYGKQGYGNARGIWQTVYLEARGQQYLESFRFSPDIDRDRVLVEVFSDIAQQVERQVKVQIKTPQGPILQSIPVKAGEIKGVAEISIPNPRLWSLEDPFLYEVTLLLGEDTVNTYFGMRKISVIALPGTSYPYVALNNKPIYLQLTLDQSYHPEGYYTFPSDAFMREEIQRTKDLGLNGIRTHIKVDIPRKLYWADKLGLLVMSDLPNSWGEPDAAMQEESERTLRAMIRRDYNHPAIFSWVVFNESWGLHTRVMGEKNETRHVYLPATQNWVASMYYLAKSLDQTRLVEDNSICCGGGHTETDLNSWHEYMAGWEWEGKLATIDRETYPGSSHHFEKGFLQGRQPNINSECGNVWGYAGSTGDVDWSWDYHRMINTFRKYPKVAGWLYTEHHDVINEWNGYWRFDRSPKFSGLEDLAPGMSDRDFHAPLYISSGNEISRTVRPGEAVQVPLYLSDMGGKPMPDNYLTLETIIYGQDKSGMEKILEKRSRLIPYVPFMQKTLDPEILNTMPYGGIMRINWLLKDTRQNVLHRNFFCLIVESAGNPGNLVACSVPPTGYKSASWTQKTWHILDSLKANGAGKGYFEYQIPLKGIKWSGIKKIAFLAELSAKPLLDKDLEGAELGNQNYMLGDRVSPHKNPNAYPMTDQYQNQSQIEIFIEGKKVLTKTLADDPADHRGILSWHYQLQDKKLREAGTHGERIEVPIAMSVLKKAQQKGFLTVRINADNGLAVYGDKFGRYPINPGVYLWYE